MDFEIGLFVLMALGRNKGMSYGRYVDMKYYN